MKTNQTTLIRGVVLAAIGGLLATSPLTAAPKPFPVPFGAPVKGISKLGYAIQLGAFSDVKNAERLANQLQTKGLDAFYYRKDNGIYAVRFGSFPTHDKALAVARQLVKDKVIDRYYITPPNEVVFKNAPPKNVPPASSDTRLPAYRSPFASGEKPPLPPLPPAKPAESKSEPPLIASRPGEKDMGGIVARTAERFVGIPYQWGGNTVVDGLDCSGFVRAVYNLCGVNIPRTSREQFKTGTSVTLTDLRDGDLVFFGTSEQSINHVGIYVGGGRFVHAPRRGEDIKITPVSEPYFTKRFIGAKRYFQPAGVS